MAVRRALPASACPSRSNGDQNKLHHRDRAVHDWYRFVLSFPPHLVRDYLQRFGLNGKHQVLDPFCGTGTTLVECKKVGIPCIGVEANPMAFLASSAKVDWNIDPEALLNNSRHVARAVLAELEAQGISDIHPLFSPPDVRLMPFVLWNPSGRSAASGFDQCASPA